MSKILVFSIPPINKDSNNTFELLFKNINKKHKLYFLSCRDGTNNSDTFKEIYTLSENKAIKSIFKRKIDIFAKTNPYQVSDELKIYKKNNHFHNIKRIIRDCLWALSNWKKSSLKTFLTDESFDYIVAPSEGYHYYLRVLKYICNVSKAKLILYTWDDNFTFKQGQLSPLFFFYRIKTRHLLKNISKKYLFKTISISNKTKAEADQFFKSDSVLVKKTIPFCKFKKLNNKEIKIIYAGNLLNGREKSLLKIAQAIQDESFNNIRLNIFTDNIGKKTQKKLAKLKNVYIHNAISHDELIKEENNSDIGLMLESLSFGKKKISRLSISTKFTDYIGSNLPIFAIMDDKSATAEEIQNNCLGYVVSNKSQIENMLKTMINAFLMNKFKESISNYKNKYTSEKQDLIINQLFL